MNHVMEIVLQIIAADAGTAAGNAASSAGAAAAQAAAVQKALQGSGSFSALKDIGFTLLVCVIVLRVIEEGIEYMVKGNAEHLKNVINYAAGGCLIMNLPDILAAVGIK